MLPTQIVPTDCHKIVRRCFTRLLLRTERRIVLPDQGDRVGVRMGGRELTNKVVQLYTSRSDDLSSIAERFECNA